MRASRATIRVMERGHDAADAWDMNPSHDPRPASRYQAVTPTAYRQATAEPGPFPIATRTGPSSDRVLRHVQARVVRLEPAR